MKPPKNGVSCSRLGLCFVDIDSENTIDLHLFASSQPDLNWDNPEVRDAVYDVIDFWGSKGTDGFRVSKFIYCSKQEANPAA